MRKPDAVGGYLQGGVPCKRTPGRGPGWKAEQAGPKRAGSRPVLDGVERGRRLAGRDEVADRLDRLGRAVAEGGDAAGATHQAGGAVAGKPRPRSR